MTIQRIREILNAIDFQPSCVDMGWRWEITTSYEVFDSPNAVAGDRGCYPNGFLIRTTFKRPDRDTGRIEHGYGRWWHVPANVSESGIVKTAYKAAQLILEHELMEAFHYEGTRIFDPHHDVEDLFMAAQFHELGPSGRSSGALVLNLGERLSNIIKEIPIT